MTKPIRVLHAPTMVGGNPVGLARAERALGLESVAVSLEETPFRYEVDEVLWRPGDGALRRELLRLRLLRRALREFDAIHFNFGSSLMPRRRTVPDGASPLKHGYALYSRAVEFRDLPLLRRAGKAVVVTYQGDDARLGEESRRLYELSLGDLPGYYSAAGDAATRRGIRAFDRYAHRIYALNPDLLSFLPARAEFLPYANVDPSEWTPRYRSDNEVPVVVHAPTDRTGKGTAYILAALERLREEGIPFELVLVEGVSHAEAQVLYERADLAVDQLVAGWYGGFAVELMSLGKPVVAYLREQDLARLPDEMRASLPVQSARPETIVDVLRDLLRLPPGRREELGRAGRAYVERWHDPRAIAARLRSDYEAILGRQAGSAPTATSPL